MSFGDSDRGSDIIALNEVGLVVVYDSFKNSNYLFQDKDEILK
jgi:hypothetical protein